MAPLSTEATSRIDADFFHAHLDSGVELAVDRLPQRDTAALVFRMLTGLPEEPPELAGIAAIVESTLAKGTERFSGRELADAFEGLGAIESSYSGRESMVLRVICLPEFVLDVVELAAEMFCRPTFPEEACAVAVELAQQELRSIEDDPADVCRMMIQRLTLGPVLGRDPLGEPEALARITPQAVREHWRRTYAASRLQVAAAGPIDPQALAARLDACFGGFGGAARSRPEAFAFEFKPGRVHRTKDLKQQQIAITLPGLARCAPDFAVEQVLLGVLSGGMSGRLFTEVRERQGLVYSIAAWHEQPRTGGVIHLRASSTPENCRRTFETMLHEIGRLSEDLSEAETARARNGLIAHALTQDDLTRARAAGLSEDLFYFGRPVGLAPKIDAVRAVTREQVERYAAGLSARRACVATFGPAEL